MHDYNHATKEEECSDNEYSYFGGAPPLHNRQAASRALGSGLGVLAVPSVWALLPRNTVKPNATTKSAKPRRIPLRRRVRRSSAVAQFMMSRKRQGEMVHQIPAMTHR